MKILKKAIASILVGFLAVSTLTGCSAWQESVEIKDNIEQAKKLESGSSKGTEETVKETGTSLITSDAEYADFFDTSVVHTIDIEISEEDWEDLKANPLDKTKYKVNVTIDGETINNVSFATKGNTSLTSVASDEDSDRYSFKINFGKYEKGQTYHDLNKLNLNNIYSDSTYVKDFLSYGIFKAAGVDAPLTAYVWITINGEDHGLYLAIEDVSESYLERTDNEDGVLYKPETEMLDNIGGGNRNNDKNGNTDSKDKESSGNGQGSKGEFFEFSGKSQDFSGQIPDFSGEMQDFSGQMPGLSDGMQGSMGQMPGFSGEAPTWDIMSDESGNDGNGSSDGRESSKSGRSDFKNMEKFNAGGNFAGFGGFGGSNGADLKYTGDDPKNYSDIFDNAETKDSDESHENVIRALKAMSENIDTDQYFDIDELVRFFAAHNFVLNYDSYTGSMLHNYYLLENDRVLSVLPWDYNLAFGGFGGGSNATSLVNTGIDTPLGGTTSDSRPLWKMIEENEEYMAKYHEVYNELISTYFESGEFEETIECIYELILPYVEKDPSAFCTASEFKAAYESLKDFCLLRAASIRKQLDGELSASTELQDNASRVDASDLNLNAMGSHMGGGNSNFNRGGNERFGDENSKGSNQGNFGEFNGGNFNSKDFNGGSSDGNKTKRDRNTSSGGKTI